MKKSKTKNSAKSIAETNYLLSSPANAAHLMESIAQLKAGKTQTHKLVKMTANMPIFGYKTIWTSPNIIDNYQCSICCCSS